MNILSWGEILSCTKIDCFKVILNVIIERCSGKKMFLNVIIERCSEKKMFLKGYSSTAVKSSGGKKQKHHYYIDFLVQNFFYVGTCKNASRSKFL